MIATPYPPPDVLLPDGTRVVVRAFVPTFHGQRGTARWNSRYQVYEVVLNTMPGGVSAIDFQPWEVEAVA